MHRGVDDSLNEAKNSIDNPDNARANDNHDGRVKPHAKKEVQNQIQESNTQMNFKVDSLPSWRICTHNGVFPCLHDIIVLINIVLTYSRYISGSNKRASTGRCSGSQALMDGLQKFCMGT